MGTLGQSRQLGSGFHWPVLTYGGERIILCWLRSRRPETPVLGGLVSGHTELLALGHVVCPERLQHHSK